MISMWKRPRYSAVRFTKRLRLAPAIPTNAFCLILGILLFSIPAFAQTGTREIRVGYFQNEPLSFLDKENKVQGIFPDVIREIAEREQWHLTFVRDSWAGCLERMKKGELDLVVSVVKSPERDVLFDFSNQSVITAWGSIYTTSQSGIRGILDLKDKKIAVMESDITAKNFMEINRQFNLNCRLVEVKTYHEVCRLIQSRKVDAGVINNINGGYLSRTYKISASPIVFSPVNAGFAAPKGKHRDLLAAIDRNLVDWKKDRSSVYFRILNRWYGEIGLDRGVSTRLVMTIVGIGVGAAFLLLAWTTLLRRQVRARTRELSDEKTFIDTALNKVRDIIILYDPLSGKAVRWNRAFRDITGYSDEEIGTLRVPHAYYSDVDMDRIKSVDSDFVKTGYASLTLDLRIKYGATVPMDWEVSLFKSNAGGPQYAFALGRDATERIKAENALIQSEARFRSLIEASPSVTIGISSDLTVFEFNPEAESLYGKKREDVLGKNYLKLFIPEEARSGIVEDIHKVLSGEPTRGYENPVIGADGVEKHLVWNVNRLLDENGRPTGIIAIGLDITQRKRTEEALRESAAREAALKELKAQTEQLREIFEGSPVGVGISRIEDGKILFSNRRLAEEFGMAGSTLVGQSAIDFWVSQQQRREFVKFFKKHGHIPEILVRLKKVDGTEFWCLLTWRSIEYEGNTSILFWIYDIDELKTTEEELRKTREELERKVIERTAELEQSRQNFMRAFYSSPAMMLITTIQEGRFVEVNEAYCQGIGWSRDEIIGRTSLDINLWPSEEDRNRWVEAISTGRVKGMTLQLLHRDGSPIIATGDVAIIEYDGEEVYLTTIIDITEQAKAEEALKESEAKFYTAFRSNPAAISICRLDDGRYIDINRGFTATYGYERHEVLGRTALELDLRDGSLDQGDERMRILLETGACRDLEFDFRRKNGETGTGINFAELIKLGEGVPHILSISIDITQRKRAERELANYRDHLEELVQVRNNELWESEEKYRTILENIEEGYYELDLEGNVVFHNISFCRILGYSPDEFMGLNYRKFSTPSSYRKARKVFNEMYRTGRPYNMFELEIVRKDDSQGIIAGSVYLVLDDSKRPTGFRGLMLDVTEAKRAEEELRQAKLEADRANQAKSEFLANMSHEIRTPMNSVVGMSELLLTTSLTRKQREYTETISDSAIALLTVLDDILDFSKIQAGKLNLEAAPFNLRSVMEQVGQIIAFRAQGKDVDVLVRYPLDIPSQFVGDPTRIRQILMNLAGNAVKFTEKGHVLLEVSLSGKDQDQCGIQISVSDTGIGIPEDQLDSIFDQFSQADESTTRRFGGTGLGLTISWQLVKMMGGTIKVHSAPDVGTTFSFGMILPCSDEPEPEITVDVDLADVPVLVVDDNERNREIALEYLRLRSIPGEAVSSAAEGLDRLRQAKTEGRPFGLAVLDYRMPEMNGDELALAIKNDPEISDTVLILLSSFMPVDELAPEVRAHFAASINKPIRASLFFEILTEAWRQRLIEKPRRMELTVESPSPLEPIELEARVLLVEDNPMNQQVAREVLNRFGCEVETAANGLEALELFKKRRYDMIFMDIHMPEMDGFEATRAIREAETGDAHIPIVAMTALAMHGDREKCLAAGMDDYIAKPIRTAAVREALVRFLLPEMDAEKDVELTLTADKPQVLNPETLLDISGRDPEIIAALIRQFLEDAPKYFADLKEAVDREEQRLIHQTAHRFQGLAANAGGERTREILIDLETRSRQEPFIPGALDLTKLETEMKRLVKSLQETDWKTLCGA